MCHWLCQCRWALMSEESWKEKCGDGERHCRASRFPSFKLRNVKTGRPDYGFLTFLPGRTFADSTLALRFGGDVDFGAAVFATDFDFALSFGFTIAPDFGSG